MAAIRTHLLRHFVSRLNPSSSPARFFFARSFSSTLFVKGISFSSTEETLAQAFSSCGQVLEVKVIMDKVRNRPKGYAYVTFSSEEEAKKALSVMSGTLLDGRFVFLDLVRPKHHNNSKPGASGPPDPAVEG